MKRFVLLFVALATFASATVFAANEGANVNKEVWNWNVRTERIVRYLDIYSGQFDKVALANEHFSEQLQKISRIKDEDVRGKKVREAVSENLSLMKSILNVEQYRKYVTLLNLTIRNKGLDVYLVW